MEELYIVRAKTSLNQMFVSALYIFVVLSSPGDQSCEPGLDIDTLAQYASRFKEDLLYAIKTKN